MILGKLTNNCHPRLRAGISSRAGVSLVTVLLFMLVATIAATATYKWLTSESRSSGSRMQQNEAYQSAVAGIESARSWMTYNANETGAIIKQYKDNKNVPVKLTDRLAAFVRAGQHYDVYLVGVNTENTTYKLKILSEGSSRNGNAKHSEIAILNVNGLYQVEKPIKEVHVHADFEYAYFGGSLHYEGQNDVTSMVVNGNWEHNPPKTTSGDFIVTGNAHLSGNEVNVAKTTCIGGNLDGYAGGDFNGITTKDLYIAGGAPKFIGVVSGDAYFDGNMTMHTSCGSKNFQVLGNMTVNATLNFNHCDTRYVNGNTCVLADGQIKTDGKSLELKGGAWMEADFPIWKDDDDNYNQSENLVVGTDEGTKVYIKSGHPWSEYDNLRKDRVFDEDTEHPRQCESSYSGWGTSNVCWGGPDNQDYAKFWSGETGIQAYPTERESKSDLYYIYYIEPGKKDVDFGKYWDTDWKWCTEFGQWWYNSYCTKREDKTIMNGYFINFPVGTSESQMKDYTFTTSQHKADAPYNHHKVFVPGDGYGYYRYLNHDGTKITGSPYCKLAGEKKWRPECGVKPWFTVKGKFEPWVATKPSEMTCAEHVKEHCFSVWEAVTPGTGCDGSNFVVRDPLKIASDKFDAFANKAPCAKEIAERAENDLDGTKEFADLKTCYDNSLAHDATEADNTKKHLYNEYLVVKLTKPEGTKLFKKTQGTTTIAGKYIFIIDSDGSNDAIKLPATQTSKDFVMIYFPNGFYKTGNSQIYFESNSGLFNYFIFSNKDIYGVQGKNQTLNGTIYMKQATCAKLQHMWTSNLKYNQQLMTDMVENGIVCDANATSCGGAGATPASSSSLISVEYLSGGPDDYYISVAPQLSVTLESQYKNAESVNTANSPSVEGSFIVLPRIIYLTKDARGKLSDYYNVVPLNVVSAPGAAAPVTVTNVSCDSEIPSAGKLTASGNLTEGEYTCNVSATVQSAAGAVQKSVPFYVVVAGEGGSSPKVSFVNSSEELALNNETTVELKWEKTTGAGIQCQVTVAVTDFEPEWSVSKVAGVTQNGNDYTVTFNTSNETPMKIFDVRNNSSSDGSVMFLLKDVQGCVPGDKPVEVIYNTNSITVKREGLAEYCNGVGSGLAACQPGGDYYNMIQPSWPDCNVGSEIWVSANGNNCSTIADNTRWSCGITGEVSLERVSTPTGCQVVIPTAGNSATGPFEPNAEVTLYGAVKALPQTFEVQFNVTGDLSDNQAIYISVDGSARNTCTYGDYKDAALRAQKCKVSVYRGSTVKLSFNSNPTGESEPPSGFNYWLCDEGADCTSDEPVTSTTFEVNVTGSNTVEAHFGEKDKHCFFDEFKDERHYDRISVECDESNPLYCIETCDGVCGTVSAGATKWRLLEGSMSLIDYAEGRISLKASATRGRTEAQKAGIKAVVMSTAQAGKDGELKAQFQVPVEGYGAGDVAKATVKNSGFILRSDASKTSYLMLNVFTTSNGTLKARLCVNGASDKCKEKAFENLISIASTDIILMSAHLTKDGNNDVLKVKVWPGSWASELSAKEVSFTLTDTEIPDVATTAQNEYVGYSLANQNFKIYGIGWKSDTYNAQCWDTPPTISCSFKAAYTGGIVPLDEHVKPWVGLSAWYSTAHVDGCIPVYYYNGDDAGCMATVDGSGGYKECGVDYRFTETGAHGYTNAESKEVKTAKASVNNCSVYGPAAAWAKQGVAANCGSFWVGEISECSKHVTFEYTTGGAEGDYYGVPGVANVRDADIKVSLDNASGDEVEIYLYSINSDGSYFYGASQPIYSLPYKTTQNGTVTIPVAGLSNVDGFDPERVGGVYVKTSGSARVNSVMSSCPNVISIIGCSAEYNKSAAKWYISTEVNNYKYAKKVKVEEISSYITDGDAECGDTPECTWSGITGPKGTNLLWIADANPYVGSTTKRYEFSVTLTTDDNETLTCEPNPVVEISGITAVCGGLSGGTTFKQGKGLPVFSYGLENCPDEHCGYKVTLTDGAGTEIVAPTESGNGNWNTDADAANKATSLDVGTYRFKLESTDGSFTSCTSDEFTITSSAVTATCNITGNLYQGQTLTLNVSSMSGLEDNQNVDMTWSLTADGSDPITKTIQCNPYNCSNNTMTAPTAGSYSYALTYGGQNVCSGNITIANASDEVVGTCNDASGYPGRTVESFASISNLDNVESNKTWSVKIGDTQVGMSNNCSKNYCEQPIKMTAPNTTGEYTYYLYFDGQEKCHATLTVNPKLTCVVDKTSLTLGETFSFTATYGGSPYNTSFTGSGVTHVNQQMNYNSIKPTATGNQTYNFSVTDGSIGSASCDAITVTVGEASPTATCPTGTINAEPGTAIEFTPTVTGCGSGCNYTVNWVGHSGDPKKSVTDYSYSSGKISFTGDATGGNNTYRFTVENKKTTDNTDDCEITVNYQKPTYNCPPNMEETVGATVSVTPTSVTNCTQGCGYKVTKSSSTGTEVIGPGTGYNSGALGSGFTGESTAQTVTYYVTLSNPAGDGTACDFDVTYKTGGSSGVSATCVVLNESGGSGLYEGQKIKLDVSNISGITENVNMVWTLNGSDKTIDCGTSNCWNNVVDAPTTAGTYSYSLSYGGKSVSGCSGSVSISPALVCSVNPKTLEQYDDYTFTATRNINCSNCSYTYDSDTQGNINFPDGKNTLTVTKAAQNKGEKNLSFSCSCNNNLTGKCSDKISVTEPSTPILSIGSSGTLVSAGTHVISCSGGSQLICWRTGDSFTFTLAGNNCTAYGGEGHGSCGSGSCKSSKQTVVTSKDMYCKGGW